MSVPVDTLGRAMPPPCLAGERQPSIPQLMWGEWWSQYLSGTLPAEYPCCVCGGWFELGQVTACRRAHLHRKALEVINSTLSEIYLCRQCKASCPGCRGAITRFQRERFDGCQGCYPHH
jgi:hypothetical protein